MARNWKLIASMVGGMAAAGVAANAYLRNSRRIRLRGRVVLITGGSRGLGLVLAREFAKAGAQVAVCARNDRDLDSVRDEFSDEGWPLLAFACDVGMTRRDRARHRKSQ
jgi:5,10-methylene-tetrahydrofolate dehydrogenase/methenyl tetrahydrofolate cyclohydrolase